MGYRAYHGCERAESEPTSRIPHISNIRGNCKSSLPSKIRLKSRSTMHNSKRERH